MWLCVRDRLTIHEKLANTHIELEAINDNWKHLVDKGQLITKSISYYIKYPVETNV